MGRFHADVNDKCPRVVRRARNVLRREFFRRSLVSDARIKRNIAQTINAARDTATRIHIFNHAADQTAALRRVTKARVGKHFFKDVAGEADHPSSFLLDLDFQFFQLPRINIARRINH
jgi:hypothetical protein